jgi:dihydrofolate synthase / folylpolyglutamate synthase
MKDQLSFEQILQYLDSKVPNKKYKFPGEIGIQRLKDFMSTIDNPQNKIKVIHIAGTSGKTSTSYYIYNLLLALGLRAGLTVSPHIIDIRERIQLNGNLISHAKFVANFNELLPQITKFESQSKTQFTYFEIMVVMAYFSFYKENLDYAVIETGLGGLLDGSNIVNRDDKICVITQIGLDHTDILGDTLAAITLQKSGIIQDNNLVITNNDDIEVIDTIAKVCSNKNSKLIHLNKSKFSYKSNLPKFQIKNFQIALKVAELVCQRENQIYDEFKLVQKAINTYIPGRFEIITIDNKNIILDGAHNPQKILALVQSIQAKFPNQKFAILLAIKSSKDISNIVKIITPIAYTLTITNFKVKQDMVSRSYKLLEAENLLKNTTDMPINYISNTSKAYNFILKSNHPILITGSLYLISQIKQLIDQE